MGLNSHAGSELLVTHGGPGVGLSAQSRPGRSRVGNQADTGAASPPAGCQSSCNISRPPSPPPPKPCTCRASGASSDRPGSYYFPNAHIWFPLLNPLSHDLIHSLKKHALSTCKIPGTS